MGYVDVGINIKAHNTDALRGIAAVKASLASLRREQGYSAIATRQQEAHTRRLSKALHEQSRTVKSLTLDYVSLRRAILTLGVRGAITGLVSLTSMVNSLAVSVGTLAGSLANLGTASVLGGISSLAALGQGVGVLSLALNNLGKAYTTTGHQHELAMEKLTRGQRDFFNQTKELHDALKTARALAQDGLFPGLIKAYKTLKPLAPVVAQTIHDTAQTLGYLADQASKAAVKLGPQLEKLLNRNVRTMQRMGDATIHIGSGFVRLFAKADPLIGHMTKGIQKFGRSFDESIHKWAKSGSLKKFFDELQVSWDNWTATLGASFKGMFGFWEAIQPVVHKVENALERSSKKFAEWTNKPGNQTKINKFFDDALAPMGEFLGLLGDVAKLWVTFADAGNENAVRFFRGIRKHVLPVFEDLFLYLNGKVLPKVMELGGAFLDLVREATPGIKSLLGLLGPFAEIMIDILGAAKDIVDYFNGLGSVAGAIATFGVGVGIISSWKKLRTAISLTWMTMRAVAGSPGAVVPNMRDFSSVVPGVGAYRGGRSIVRGVRRSPAFFASKVRDRSEAFFTRSHPSAAEFEAYYGTTLEKGRKYYSPSLANRVHETRSQMPRPGVGGVFPYGSTSPSFAQTAGLPYQDATGRWRDRATGRFIPAPIAGFRREYNVQNYPTGASVATPVTRLRSNITGRIIPRLSGTEGMGPRNIRQAPGRSTIAYRQFQGAIETPIAKGTSSGFLRGLRSAARGIGGTGIPQAIAFSVALAAAPMVVSKVGSLFKDNRPKPVRDIDKFSVDRIVGGQRGGIVAMKDSRLQQAQKDLEGFIKVGDSGGMRKVAANILDIADAMKDVERSKGLRKAAGDVQRLAVVTDGKLLGTVVPDFEEFAKRGDKTISGVLDGLAVLQNEIGNKVPESSIAYKQAMASSFGQAAASIKAALERGGVNIKKYTRQYKILLMKQFEELGFTKEQQRNLVATGGVDPTGKKGGNENPGGVNYKSNARGGFYLGHKGERGRDTVPMNVGGTPVVAARGEYVGIFNAQQQKAFSAMAAASGYGGMEGFFSANNRPHYMAGGGIVRLGNRLERMGYDVSEQSHFGGVHPVHVANSYHYRDQALDVNADHWPMGEMKALDKLNKLLSSEGWHTLWRTKGHFDHLHVDTAFGIGKIMEKLKRITLGGSGMLKGIVQGTLDRFRAGANSALDTAAGSMDDTNEASIPGISGGDASANMTLAKQMMRAFGWSDREWPSLRSLGMGESGWITDRTNSSSGAFGIGQFLGATKDAYAKYGANTRGNAGAQINAMLHYIKDRYGSPSTAYSTWLSRSPHWYSLGGMIPAYAGFFGPPSIGDDYPDVDPSEGAVPNTPSSSGSDSDKNKDKKKRHYAGNKPGIGAGYSRKDFAKKFAKKSIHARKKIRRLIHKRFTMNGGFTKDPITGELSSRFENSFNKYQGLYDRWGGDLGSLQSRYDSAEGLSPGSGFNLLDDMLYIHETKPFDDGKGHGLLGLLMYQKMALESINANPAISERRGRLGKMKKFVLANIKLRKKYAEKMKKMKSGSIGWKGAVSSNKDIIQEWQRWKRDSDETPAQRREADHEIDRLTDENRWLTDHKPSRLSTGSPEYKAAFTKYLQRGYENRLLTGDENIRGWTPGSFADNSAAGKILNQLDFWTGARDFKNGNLPGIKTAFEDEKGVIAGLRHDIGLGPSSTNTTERDDLLKSIGESVLIGKYRSGLNFDALSDFARLLGMRSVGAFAHGGPVNETGAALVHRGEYIIPAPDGPFRRGMNAPSAVHSTPSITLVLKDRAGALIELVDARINDRSASVSNRQVGRSARQISVAPGGRR